MLRLDQVATIEFDHNRLPAVVVILSAGIINIDTIIRRSLQQRLT